MGCSQRVAQISVLPGRSDVFPGPNLMCFTLRRGVLHLNLPFLHTFLNIETCKKFSEK